MFLITVLTSLPVTVMITQKAFLVYRYTKTNIMTTILVQYPHSFLGQDTISLGFEADVDTCHAMPRESLVFQEFMSYCIEESWTWPNNRIAFGIAENRVAFEITENCTKI